MKVGMIAMSGVRACDPELVKLGLTLPGFVERSKVIASLPSLGLLTLAGMTTADHDVSYHEIAEYETPGSFEKLPTGFDLVAISSLSAQIQEAYRVAEWYRAKGIKVVMGGLHVTSMPDEAKRHCDAVAVGEGELLWHDILDDAAKSQLKKEYRTSVEFDLANAPMPAFHLLDIEKYNRLTVQTSRGCPRRCEFCASSILLTARYKQKPIINVLKEIDRVKELWPNPFLELADDNAFINKAYWRSLLPDLKRRRIKWFAESDISVASDPELLKLMRQSGCVQILIGLESPTRSGLDGVEIRTNWKLKQWSRYKDAVRAIQSVGISVNGCFVVGLDNHDTSIFDTLSEFVDELGLHQVQITVPTPFPGTPFYERLHREGRILEDRAWDRCTLFDVNFQPARLSAQELRVGFRELMAKLYSKEQSDNRRRHFRKQLRGAVTRSN